MSYDLVRALHIIFVIAWMAGMLMLPRLMAYQTGAERGGELERKMIEGIRRLRMIIINPAMLLTWAFGLHLLFGFLAPDFSGGVSAWLARVPAWFWAKFALVLALSGIHGYLVGQSRKMANGAYKHSERFWRVMNELPFVIAIAAVLLATLEPWR